MRRTVVSKLMATPQSPPAMQQVSNPRQLVAVASPPASPDRLSSDTSAGSRHSDRAAAFLLATDSAASRRMERQISRKRSAAIARAETAQAAGLAAMANAGAGTVGRLGNRVRGLANSLLGTTSCPPDVDSGEAGAAPFDYSHVSSNADDFSIPAGKGQPADVSLDMTPQQDRRFSGAPGHC